MLEDELEDAPLQASDMDSDTDTAASGPDSDAEEDQKQLPKSASSPKKDRAGRGAGAVAEQPQDDALAELQQFENAQERREELKQQLAVTASKVLQNPEAHLPTLKSVLALAADKDAQVRLRMSNARHLIFA